MHKLFLFILPLSFMASKHDSYLNSPVNLYHDTVKSITVFNDRNYSLRLYIFNQEFDWLTNNATLTFTQTENGKPKILFSDSLLCMGAEFKMEDFNNDSVKDILVFGFSDVRSNESYYLYLVDKKHKRLIKVQGFEKIKNPEFDAKNNVITSFAVSGTDNYSFFRINRNNRLIDFKKGFEAHHDEGDSIRYERIIRQIRTIKN